MAGARGCSVLRHTYTGLLLLSNGNTLPAQSMLTPLYVVFPIFNDCQIHLTTITRQLLICTMFILILFFGDRRPMLSDRCLYVLSVTVTVTVTGTAGVKKYFSGLTAG